MSTVLALDGTKIYFTDDSVAMVAGPYPSDPSNRSYISIGGPASIAVQEEAQALVARLHPMVSLALLTRPDGSSGLGKRLSGQLAPCTGLDRGAAWPGTRGSSLHCGASPDCAAGRNYRKGDH